MFKKCLAVVTISAASVLTGQSSVGAMTVIDSYNAGKTLVPVMRVQGGTLGGGTVFAVGANGVPTMTRNPGSPSSQQVYAIMEVQKYVDGAWRSFCYAQSRPCYNNILWSGVIAPGFASTTLRPALVQETGQATRDSYTYPHPLNNKGYFRTMWTFMWTDARGVVNGYQYVTGDRSTDVQCATGPLLPCSAFDGYVLITGR